MAVRRGRSRKEDWQREQEQFVTRDVTQYRPGELWIGDHTELDFMVINENDKPDRRWITASIDIREGLIVGHHLSWQPNSTTIALFIPRWCARHTDQSVRRIAGGNEISTGADQFGS